MKISVDVLDSRSIDRAVAQLDEYAKSLDRKANTLCARLAELGATKVSLDFSRAIYTGPNEYDVSVEEVSIGKYKVVVAGEAVLFVEFGAGVTYGNGHPLSGEFGYGPGTYPGQKHAMDPGGWYLPKAKGGGHTYGNPPNMPVYNAAKDLRREILRIAREVFKT